MDELAGAHLVPQILVTAFDNATRRSPLNRLCVPPWVRVPQFGNPRKEMNVTLDGPLQRSSAPTPKHAPWPSLITSGFEKMSLSSWSKMTCTQPAKTK